MSTATADYPAANIPGAALRFPAEQFATMRNVPVFREHKTRAVDGRMLEFGMTQLKMVCDRCNRRIAETGDYAAVVIGHTPDPEQNEAPQPELVGYAGPFRLGTIGDGERKCWAILADFHIFRDDMAKVRKHPRRSPELCLEDSYEEMFLDPIALFGAEAPRLDLGLVTGAQGTDGAGLVEGELPARKLYSFVRDGRRVEKYAMAAAAMPSAGNVHVPAASTKTPAAKYSAGDQLKPDQSNPETNMSLTPEDISAVVEAFLSTDAGQFLVSEMKSKQGVNAAVEPTQEPPAGEGAEVPPPEASAEVPPPSEESAANGAAMPPPVKKPEELPPANGDGGDEATKKYAAACGHADGMSDGDMEKYLSNRWRDNPRWKKYSAESGTVEGEGREPAAGEVVNETKDPAGNGAAPAATQLKPTQLYSRLESQLQSVQGELAAEKTARRKAERYSRLQGLSAEFIMDAEDELSVTSEMSDDQFERHIGKTIKEHYQRNPVGLPWAAPADVKSTHRDPSHPGNVARPTSQKEVDKAVERYQRKREAGQTCSFEDCLDEIKSGK